MNPTISTLLLSVGAAIAATLAYDAFTSGQADVYDERQDVTVGRLEDAVRLGAQRDVEIVTSIAAIRGVADDLDRRLTVVETFVQRQGDSNDDDGGNIFDDILGGIGGIIGGLF